MTPTPRHLPVRVWRARSQLPEKSSYTADFRLRAAAHAPNRGRAVARLPSAEEANIRYGTADNNDFNSKKVPNELHPVKQAA